MSLSSLTLFAFLSTLVGCSGGGTDVKDSGAASTDTGTTTTAGDALPLEEGEFEYTAVTFENDTCGNTFVGSTLLPVTVAWTSDEAFELRYDESAGVSTMECTWDGAAAATCTGFNQVNSGPDVTLFLDAVTNSFTIVSPQSFDITWSWALSCEGAGCEAFAAGEETTLPCALDVAGSFAKG